MLERGRSLILCAPTNQKSPIHVAAAGAGHRGWQPPLTRRIPSCTLQPPIWTLLRLWIVVDRREPRPTTITHTPFTATIFTPHTHTHEILWSGVPRERSQTTMSPERSSRCVGVGLLESNRPWAYR